jgi:adenosylcobinamide kinase/adenosylcobinamide-phosphate guanylyltransferase
MTPSSKKNGKSTLILGGAGSGKSCFAEKMATNSGLKLVYIATASAGDAEMTARITRHRQRRGDKWATIEETLDIAPLLLQTCDLHSFVLVDCLTLWLSNLLAVGRDIRAEVCELGSVLDNVAGEVALVSNEIGMGIVPGSESVREYRDLHGYMNRQLAEIADDVMLVVAGLPLELKKAGAQGPREL